MRSFAALAILWVVGLAVSPSGAGAQTPSESLDQNWINVCDTTSTNRFTAFDQRCLEIL